MARGGIGTEEAAQIKGRIRLLKGEKINIRVGGDTNPIQNLILRSTIYYGGGGGTYIVKDVDEPTDGDIIVIAGGSGNIGKNLHCFSVPDPPPNIKTAAQAKLYNIKNDNGIGGINNTSKAIGGGGGGLH